MKSIFTATFFLFLLGFSIQLTAQERIISGMVSSTEGDPLIGANVTVMGAAMGTTTNLEGRYEIRAERGDVLLFSYVGYEDREVKVVDQTVIDVRLGIGVSLDEVVVTALGLTRERKALGYAVDQVGSDVIGNSGKNDIVGALQGRVAGVTIQTASGAPGAGSSIVIRGMNSLDPGRSSRPLYIIDGIEVSDDVDVAPAKPAGADYGQASNDATQGSVSNRIMDINPDDIASMSLLKGAAATSLYGVRAANGVIIINTKKGQAGKPVVNIHAGFGYNQVNRFPNVQTRFIDGNRSTTLARPGYFWDTWGPLKYAETDVPTYNPYQAFYQTGNNLGFGASLTAGTERFNYRISAGRNNSEGVVPHSYYNKTNFSLNAGYQVSDRIQVETSFIFTHADGNTPHEGRKSVANVLAYTPTTADMTQYSEPYTYGGNQFAGIIDHALFLAENNQYLGNLNRYIGNARLNYKLSEGVSLNYVLGFDNYSDYRNRIIHPETDEGQSAVNGPPYGFTAISNIGKTSVTSNLYLSWARDLGSDFSISGNMGQYTFGYNTNRVSVIGKKFQLEGFYNLNNAADFEQSNEFIRYRNLAVYADVTAGYKNYLYLTLSARNDWSSTLPAANQSYFFPSVNLSWILSEMLGLPDFISYLKLRGSYSIVGKDADPYVVGQYYDAAFAVPFNGIVGYRVSSYVGDENLKPEFTKSLETGMELKLLDNRVGLDLTYYQNNLEDMILPVPLSNATGASRYVTNAGAMRTQGWEIAAYLDLFRSKSGFNWTVGLNWSTYQGTIEEINTGVDEIAIMDLRNVQYKYVLGGKVGDLYGYAFDRTPDGDLIIDSNGFPRMRYDTTVYLGNALPDFTAGLVNDLSYKGLGLSFLWEWKKGGKVIDIARNYSRGNGQLEETTNRYEQIVFNGVRENENGEYVPNDIPVELTTLNWYRNGNRGQLSPDIDLQDASWIRLRNLSLYYNVPQSILKDLFIDKIRLTLTGNNLFVNTPFNGWDPESNYFGPDSNIFGYTGLRTPPVRSINFKVNLTF
jgi:TonB-linked SusC/RagA family outer membrane protein